MENLMDILSLEDFEKATQGLALMKLSAWHKAKGDTVEWWWSDFFHYDTVYMSKVFRLHCPLSDRTFHLMNADAFSKMKKSAVLINVARGAVVDTDALYEALVNGEIRGAGTDVFEKEPILADNPLATLKETGKLREETTTIK